ncbi:MAG: response regulator transcription factor [Janthinobacterium lividum]
MKRILIVDDERQIIRMLRTALQSSGYEVSIAYNGMEALGRMKEQPPDLVVTDLAMPELNGVEFTQTVRRQSEVPIIILSVRDSEVMKVRALDEGADDYITKPFNMPELLARVRAQLRRSPANAPATHLEEGNFVVDTELHSVLMRGQKLHLTPKEFDLMLFFMRNPRRVLTHKVLLRAIWGLAGEDQPEYLRVLIAQLRRKIEAEPGPRYVHSEPWVGYRFEPKGEETDTDLLPIP